MNRRAYQKYSRYNRWWRTTELGIIRIALLLFLVLYASQLINFIVMERGGTFLTAQIEKLEGKAISDSQTKINTGTVEFTVTSNSDYHGIQIYINGEYYSNFNKKTVSLTIKNNDIIEFNGINNEYPAQVEITSVSKNVSGLKPGELIRVNKNFAVAGRIILK